MSLGIEVREAEEELREAAANGDVEAVMRMIESGVDVNSQNPVNGWLVAMHFVIFYNLFTCQQFIRVNYAL